MTMILIRFLLRHLGAGGSANQQFGFNILLLDTDKALAFLKSHAADVMQSRSAVSMGGVALCQKCHKFHS